jgi:hypothetical protein
LGIAGLVSAGVDAGAGAGAGAGFVSAVFAGSAFFSHPPIATPIANTIVLATRPILFSNVRISDSIFSPQSHKGHKEEALFSS